MDEPRIQEVPSSRILQGCLFGSVFIFVALLVAMLILAYLRFREATGPDGIQSPAVPGAVSVIHLPGIGRTG